MENLLDYLLYALFGHNVTNVHSHSGSGHDALTGKTWTIVLEDQVYFTLDESDICVIRALYDRKKQHLDSEECARYEKIFSLCV